MSGNKRSPPRIWIWAAVITIGISLLLTGAWWYFSRYWKPMLSEQIKQLVIEASDSLYTIEYSGFSLNVATGNATVRNFRLIPHERVYQKLLAAKKAPDNVVSLSVEKLQIENFHPTLLYRQKKLNIRSILIVNPRVQVTNNWQAYNESQPPLKSKNLYQIVSRVFKEVRVDQIVLRNIDFAFHKKDPKNKKTTAVRNLNVRVTDLFIDSLSEKDKSRFYHARNIHVYLKQYQIATSDSLYYLNLHSMAFSAAEKRLFVKKIELVPRYSRVEFYKKVGYAKDRFHLNFHSVSLRGIESHQFSKSQKLIGSSLRIGSAEIEVYNNRAYPRNKKDKTGRFPHQQLQKLALTIKIDTLRLRNTLLSYREYNPKSKQTGRLVFSNLNGRFYNLTNDPVALKKNSVLKVHLVSNFMNAGRLTTDFTFNLLSKTGGFFVAGDLQNMDAGHLNGITKPLGMIEVKRGWINTFKFKISGNEQRAKGTVDFYYSNLAINVLKKDEGSGKLKKQGLVSTAANILVLQEDNPNQKGEFTQGTIYYRRVYWQSFFGFLWKSLFTGIKESAGLSEEKESKLRKTVRKISSFFSRMKENKEKRKQERLEKREEKEKQKEQKQEEKEAKKEQRREEESLKDSLRKE